MAQRKGRARAIKLPAGQFEALRVMGIDVPWIVRAESGLVQATADASQPSLPMGRDSDVASDVISGTRTAPTRSTERLSAEVATLSSRPSAPAQGSTAAQVELSSMGLEQLSQCIRDCQACGLSSTRQNAVPGQGVHQPTLMVVGEAPGEQEDLRGLPFVGPSGQLLDNMLAAIGLSREQNVYIANTVKCRPPGNRNPRDDEIQSCMPYLQRQIELLQPAVILAVGLFASQTLLKSSSGVQALRQQSHNVQIAGRQIPVVVTYHPAYLLRRPADKRLAWDDLKRVWSLLHH